MKTFVLLLISSALTDFTVQASVLADAVLFLIPSNVWEHLALGTPQGSLGLLGALFFGLVALTRIRGNRKPR